MTEILSGGDSALPKPELYPGHEVWGVYVAGDAFHVWTREEVAGLAPHVTKVLPIVVPPQNEEWWLDNHGYATLESLVRKALDWGVPEGAPLCLDIEEAQSEKMGTFAGDVFHAWAVATRVHKLRTWTYGSRAALAYDQWGIRWLAEWPTPAPADPQMPEGFGGWQYASDVIDHDIFEAHRIYMSPHCEVVDPIGSPAPTLAAPDSETASTEPSEPAASDPTSEAAVVAPESVTPADVTAPLPPEPSGTPSVTITVPQAIEDAITAIRSWFTGTPADK